MKTLDGSWTVSFTFYWGFKFHILDTENVFALIIPLVRIYVCAFDPTLLVIGIAKDKK